MDIRYPQFKSSVTKKYFGRGIHLDMCSSKELKAYLRDITNLVHDQYWTRMVVIGYLSPDSCEGWDIGILTQRMSEIEEDIKIAQQRIRELVLVKEGKSV